MPPAVGPLHDLAPGDRIAGKYEVVRVIGEGGMGVVYEVMHTRLQQRAAIKMLLPRVQMLPDVVARFEREARAVCRLRSRYAVRVLDVDHDVGPSGTPRAYMVMEYLDGHDLSRELEARRQLPMGEGVDLLLQACAAMAEAHASGVVHRDLKPSNLFLVREGARRVVKVLDFGISKITSEGESAVTSTFATMGTPLYMSPEQVRSTKNVDGRTDVWSLGVILFEVLTGERPFQGTTTAAAAAIVADDAPALRARVPDAPEALEAAIFRALAKKAEERFPDVASFAEALAPFAAHPALLEEVRDAVATRVPGPSFAPRASSSPSFVHATTLAQPTPPVSRPVSPLAASLERVPSRPGGPSSGGAPHTEATWSENGETARSPVTRIGGFIAVVVVAGALAGVWFARAARAPAPASTAAAASASLPPPVVRDAGAPASTSPASPVAAVPSAAQPAPVVATPTPPSAVVAAPLPRSSHHASPRPGPPSASPPANTNAAPAATNPVHL